MPYLRGSQKKVFVAKAALTGPKTVRQELLALKRKVAENSKTPYHFRAVSTFLAAGGGWKLDRFLITNTFTTDPNYHDNITGDCYINKHLHLNVSLNATINNFRLLVYVPKNPDIRWNPTVDATGYVSHPDPNSFWVLKDFYLNNELGAYYSSSGTWTRDGKDFMVSVPLRNLKTIFNTDNNVIEKGNVIIQLMWYDNGTVSSNIARVGAQLTVVDK